MYKSWNKNSSICLKTVEFQMLVTKTLFCGWQQGAGTRAGSQWYGAGGEDTHDYIQPCRLSPGRASGKLLFLPADVQWGTRTELSDSPSVLEVALTMLRLNYCLNSIMECGNEYAYFPMQIALFK